MIEYRVLQGSKTHITRFPVWDIAFLGVSFGLAAAVVLLGVGKNGK